MNSHAASKSALRIASILSIVIFILASINGIFTFSGAHLFIDEILFAALFAVAVQFAIAVSLISLPYVRGLGKLVLMVVYTAALTLSTLSAYTFIYNAGLPGALNDTAAVDIHLKARVADQLSEAMSAEQQFIDDKTQRLAFLERQAEEEAAHGYRSGRGAGKGPEYYRKLEQLAADRVRFETEIRKHDEAGDIYAQMNQALQNNSGEQRESLILLLSRLKPVLNTDTARQTVTEISQGKLAVIPSPVETAMNVIMDRDHYSVQLAVSIVWAAVFDLLALFLGVIRYYILRPDYSVLTGVYDMIAAFVTFIIRLGYIRRDARHKFNQDVQNQSRGTALNSSEMQSFATYVLAGSRFSADEGEDAAAPLQNLIRHIEPLKLENDPRGVGIPFDVIEEQREMKTLMAMLIQNEVFISDVRNNAYVLNPGSDMAHKILVFIRMGLNDASNEADISRFMLSAEAS